MEWFGSELYQDTKILHLAQLQTSWLYVSNQATIESMKRLKLLFVSSDPSLWKTWACWWKPTKARRWDLCSGIPPQVCFLYFSPLGLVCISLLSSLVSLVKTILALHEVWIKHRDVWCTTCQTKSVTSTWWLSLEMSCPLQIYLVLVRTNLVLYQKIISIVFHDM